MDYGKDTYAMVDYVYPMVEASLNKNSNLYKFKSAIAEFINYNHSQLYDIAPYDIIYYRAADEAKIWNALGISSNDIKSVMSSHCGFWNKPYNPNAAKEPYVVAIMMCIRYFLKHKKQKEAEITSLYLAFTGKFYASLYGWDAFPKVSPSKYRTVMDYVVNNMLTNKHDLKSTGNVIGAVTSLSKTWLGKYGDDLKDRICDDDVGKQIQQLRDRERSFLMNIAKLYYQAYENKNYLNYETDNLSDGDEFRITDSDSLKATRYTENAVNYMTSNAVSLRICNMCKDNIVKATEVKDIMQSIIMEKENLNDIYRVTNILVCDFISQYPTKSINSVDFLAHSIKAKPNTRKDYIIELNQIITRWLDENSPNYRRRKSRPESEMSYRRSCLNYIALCIVNSNK